MLAHGMTLLSFRLFRKNLGNLREFFGQKVHRPPGKKIARTPMFKAKGNNTEKCPPGRFGDKKLEILSFWGYIFHVFCPFPGFTSV